MEVKESRRLQLLELLKTHEVRAVAECLGVRTNQLYGYKGGSREIGAAVARRIEHCCDKPAGWMDVDPTRQQLTVNEMRLVQAYRHPNPTICKMLEMLVLQAENEMAEATVNAPRGKRKIKP